MKRIYLDYASTTPVMPEIQEKVKDYFSKTFENPSALYSQKIKYDIEQARSKIADALGAKSSEIVFTSGGTEANNLAIFGIARQYQKAHFITTAIEHDSVLAVYKQLEKEGHRVTFLPVDAYGQISLIDLEKAICQDTKLISVMMVNNEIGTIQKIKEISELAHQNNVLFHTDAVQAISQMEVKVTPNIDLLTLSAHKIYAPKGSGALYVKKGVKLQSLLFGGNQESGRRAGTENVMGIIGFGYAIEENEKSREKRIQITKELGDLLLKEIKPIKDIRLNGHPSERVNSLFHFSIDNVRTEALLTMLDLNGISISAGSACQAGSYQVSHVMKAIEKETNSAHLRVSLGKDNNKEDILRFSKVLKESIEKLRN